VSFSIIFYFYLLNYYYGNGKGYLVLFIIFIY